MNYDLSHYYYKDQSIYLIALYEPESNKIILLHVKKFFNKYTNIKFIEISNNELQMVKNKHK